MESDVNHLQNMIINLVLNNKQSHSTGLLSFTDSQALCIENSIVKNCSTTTLFHSPFLIVAPGTKLLNHFTNEYFIFILNQKRVFDLN